MRFAHTLVVLGLIGSASTAVAQSCVGLSSFAAGPIRLDAGISTGNDVTTFLGGVSAGAPNGPFGSVHVISYKPEDIDERSTGFSLSGGWEFELSRSAASAPRISLCPVVGFQRVSESEEVEGIEVEGTARNFQLGIALGTTIGTTSALRFAPFGALSFNRLSAEVEGGGFSFEEDEDYGTIDLGIGILVSRIFTIRPMVTIPVGLEESDPTFGVSVHLNFGR
jgi:hypothetical protein